MDSRRAAEAKRSALHILAQLPFYMEPDAIKLRDYMSELSERAYCAGWMEGIEYALWNAVLRGDSNMVNCKSLELTPQN